LAAKLTRVPPVRRIAVFLERLTCCPSLSRTIVVALLSVTVCSVGSPNDWSVPIVSMAPGIARSAPGAIHSPMPSPLRSSASAPVFDGFRMYCSMLIAPPPPHWLAPVIVVSGRGS
jgi:hypothetical protein